MPAMCLPFRKVIQDLINNVSIESSNPQLPWPLLPPPLGSKPLWGLAWTIAEAPLWDVLLRLSLLFRLFSKCQPDVTVKVKSDQVTTVLKSCLTASHSLNPKPRPWQWPFRTNRTQNLLSSHPDSSHFLPSLLCSPTQAQPCFVAVAFTVLFAWIPRPLYPPSLFSNIPPDLYSTVTDPEAFPYVNSPTFPCLLSCLIFLQSQCYRLCNSVLTCSFNYLLL